MSKHTSVNHFAHWQADFTQSLLEELSPSLLENIKSHTTDTGQQRFAIYQNNVFHSLTAALGDLYPVVKKLVGDDFFTGTATHYLRKNPPKQAAMVHLGHDFASFLEQFKHTQNMTYLAAMARVELARHNAYHAIDAPPLSAHDIEQIAPETLASAQLKLHPSLQLLKSEHPIFDIWQINQEGNNTEENININEPQQVLVVRPLYEVCMYNIDLSTYYFIDCLSSGQFVQQAIEITLATHDDFNIGNAINFILQEQLLTHIHIQ
jgi:hypothetical protein